MDRIEILHVITEYSSDCVSGLLLSILTAAFFLIPCGIIAGVTDTRIGESSHEEGLDSSPMTY